MSSFARIGTFPGRLSLLAAVLVGLLAACSTLREDGPKTAVLLNKDRATTGKIAVVDLDPAVASLLSAVQSPSLRGAFGDYRPPGSQRIGVGDAVQITLWEAGQGGLFSSPALDRYSTGSRSAVIPDQVVARDGSITVPFAGRIPVAGRTPPEVERLIVQRLTGKAIDPQALVSLTRNVSNTASVIGDAGGGMRVPLSVRGDRLLSVIAASGGVKAAVATVTILLSREGRTVPVPMQVVVDNPQEDVYVRPDDVITLVSDPQSFTVVGATGRSGVLQYDALGLKLDQAIAKAGGLIDERADPNGLFVLRYEEPAVARRLPQTRGVTLRDGMVPVVYHLNLRAPDSLFLAHSFPIHNHDIVYVSNSKIVDLQKVFNLFNLLVSPAVTGLYIAPAVP